MRKLLYTVVLTFQVYACYSCIVWFEAERGTSNGEQMFRSRASNEIAVLLKSGDKINHTFRTNASCGISVMNVIYSNDGLSDTISVTVNGTFLGNFQSRAETGNGLLWNVFRSSGPLGTVFEITPGEYILTLTVAPADENGVEIDEIILSVVCANIIDVGPNEECPKSVVSITDSNTEFKINTQSDSHTDPNTDFGDGTSSDNSDTGLTTGEIIGIVAAVVGIVIAVPGSILATLNLKKKCTTWYKLTS